MKVINEPNEKKGKDMGTDKYEFRSCGGSVEPDDKAGDAGKSGAQKQ